MVDLTQQAPIAPEFKASRHSMLLVSGFSIKSPKYEISDWSKKQRKAVIYHYLIGLCRSYAKEVRNE